MTYKCSCIICQKETNNKGINTHYERAHLKQKIFSSGNNGKYDVVAQKAKARKLDRIQSYRLSPKSCKQCDTIIPYEQRNNFYCSHSCRAKSVNTGRVLSQAWKTSIQHGRQKFLETYHYKDPPTKTLICKTCNKTKEVPKSSKRIFCSRTCTYQHRTKQANLGKTPIQVYRKACQFKFNLADFSNEFDFSLVEQYGWYKAKNRGNNLTGVSRDHCISIRYGYEHNIPAEHIAHPANCKLMQHTENMKKNTDIEFSYEELLAKIADWNYKYN